MLALYLSAFLIEARQKLNSDYIEYTDTYVLLEESMHGFEDLYAEYLSGDPLIGIVDIKESFKKLSLLLEKMEVYQWFYLTPGSKDYVRYDLMSYKISTEMATLAHDLMNFEMNGDPKYMGSGEFQSKKRSINKVHEKANTLNGLIVNSVTYPVINGGIKHKEYLLYWVIFAMGICGFVLIIMNSNKLEKMKRLNKEKIGTVDLLENRLAALEAATDGIFIMNPKGEVTYLNNAFYNILCSKGSRFKRENFIGKTWSGIFSRSDFEFLQEDVFPELNKRGVWMGDFQMFADNKTLLYVDMSLTRLLDGGVIGTMQDISYKKKAEKEKKDLEEQFYQAQKMEAIGRLAGGIAHDFNNILAAMNGYAEFLIDDLNEGSEQKQFAKNILSAGMQARDLVDQMLDFSRRGDSKKNSMDLVSSLKEPMDMVRVGLPRTIELNENMRMNKAYINGNPTQISQLIMNLLVNAQDSIEDKHGIIKVELESIKSWDIKIADVLQDNLPDHKQPPYIRLDNLDAGRTQMVLGAVCKDMQYVKLRISDTGIGMSRVIMENIFEPFFTTKSVDKGTGLGLAMVHGVLVSHQGLLVIDSALGNGSIFDIYFPLIKGESAEIEPEVTTEVPICNLPDETNKKHILLVEDQDNVREMIVKMLERLGYQVSSAVAGMEGLDMIRENHEAYDLVITDFNMPKMTGLEMAHQVYVDLPDVKFVLLSGFGMQKMIDLIEGYPAFKEVLHKPVSKNTLKEVIESVIGSDKA